MEGKWATSSISIRLMCQPVDFKVSEMFVLKWKTGILKSFGAAQSVTKRLWHQPQILTAEIVRK